MDASDDVLDPSGVLAELSRIPATTNDLSGTLDGIVRLARDRIPGADEVSMTLIEADDRPTTAASTGQLADDLDERQYAVGWGPCLDCAVGGNLLIVPDMATEDRWPEFAKRGVEVGAGSSMSVPLPIQQSLVGALDVYSRRTHVFDERAQTLARSFAAHAALALAHSYRYNNVVAQAANLQQAMRSRAVIEQAKGIMMAIHRCSDADAFNRLVQMSQREHAKLREIAAKVVTEASGHPTSPEGSIPS